MEPDEPPNSSRPDGSGWGFVAAGLALFLSGAGVSFFLVGDVSDTFDRPTPDYMVRPWSVLNDHGTAVGLLSVPMLIVTSAAVAVWVRKGRFSAVHGIWLGAICVLGLWSGFAYRVVTAGVVGANIGGGMVVLATPVVAATVLALAVVAARRAA